MPSTERSQEKRQRVHQAAMALFVQHGFEGTSMDAIATQAAVSKPTLYRYYPNKEALFIAVLSDLALSQQPEPSLAAPLELEFGNADELAEALTTWALAATERTMQPAYTGLVRLLVAELPRFPDLGPMFYSAIPQQGAVYLTALLERGEHLGIITVPDYEAVIRLIAGGLLTYSLSGLFGSAAQPPTREQIAALMHVVVRALAAESP